MNRKIREYKLKHSSSTKFRVKLEIKQGGKNRREKYVKTLLRVVSENEERWAIAKNDEQWALAKNGERRALVNGELSQRTPRRRKQGSATRREEWPAKDDWSLVSEVRRREVGRRFVKSSRIFEVEKMGQGRERAVIQNERGFLKPLQRRGIFVIPARRKMRGV